MNRHLEPSFLYVPASKSDLFAKALASEATALIFDLEDSVSPGEKDLARDNLCHFLDNNPVPTKPTWVRINAVRGSGESDDVAIRDLDAIAARAISGVILPKAEATSVRLVAQHSPGLPLIGLIETARGLVQLSDIASESAVVGLGIGRADLLSELRIAVHAHEAFEQLAVSIVVACAAFDLAPPIAPAHLALGTDSAAESVARVASERFYALGFRSQTSIHPRNCGVINSVFTPSEAEYVQAAAVMNRFNTSDGTFVSDEGQFVDEAVVRRSRDIMLRYERK